MTEMESPSATSVRIEAQSVMVKVVPVLGEWVMEDIAGRRRVD